MLGVDLISNVKKQLNEHDCDDQIGILNIENSERVHQLALVLNTLVSTA